MDILYEALIENSEPLPVTNPYTGECLGEVSLYSWEQISSTLDKVNKGFQIISQYSLEQRANILLEVSKLLSERSTLFAHLITKETAKPLKYSLWEVQSTIDLLKTCAIETTRIHGQSIPLYKQSNQNKIASFNYHPLGVVLAISPYNFPLYTLGQKFLPALAAGNSVIIKPSPHTPLTAYNFARLFWEAGLPEECLACIFCSNELTQRIVQDPRINFLNFTGSSAVGWKLKSLLSPGAKSIMELGGNAPVIAHHDSNIERLIPSITQGAFFFSGQICISTQRLFVHRDIINTIASDLSQTAQAISIGNPFDMNTDMSSMISTEAVSNLHNKITTAKENGAEILCGGTPLDNNCYAPTIIQLSSTSHNICSEEAFGPILNLIPYTDINSAIAEANNTIYGLSAGVFTQDIDLAHHTANQLDFGTIMINDSSAFRALEVPVGAYKQSGSGIENPYHAIREMSNTKAIINNLRCDTK